VIRAFRESRAFREKPELMATAPIKFGSTSEILAPSRIFLIHWVAELMKK
jgi:hypothetical protein